MEAITNKNSNKSRILRLIKALGEISRADLAKQSALTRPTVSSIVSELEGENLIVETGKGKSSGGKRPIMLTLKNDAVFALGIDVADEYFLRGVLCDFSGSRVEGAEVPYENSFDSILESLKLLIAKLLKGREMKVIKGIGMAVSGVVDHNANEVIHSSNFDIANRGLAELISRHTGLPVYMEKRPNTAAFAEKTMGSGKEFSDFIYLTTGRGVGAGIIYRGQIFRGSFGGAGEIGKSILFSREDFLNNSGEAMLEHRMRETYLASRVEKAKGRAIKFPDILELYQSGDRDVEDIINENAELLAAAASVMCNFFNPEALILGGRKKELGEKYRSYFEEVFNTHHANPYTGKTKIVLSHFGRDGVSIGGAAMILDKTINLDL
ncbi:MAG: hypothetical protein A2020_02500 [Lentisphaerae bacterium GWF2_45_14]|nr:MAG: hypothetical protein A2020_02500 [Lentisphaerae bacterium GWF2_45_14]